VTAQNKAQQEQGLQIMTNNSEDKYEDEIFRELNNICDECKKEDESVTQNLILTSYKLCSSCRVSKTIFPI
jgi:hypothetical protein